MKRQTISWIGSLALHAGLLVWLDALIAPSQFEIFFQRGRATIELQASIAAAPRPEPEDVPTPKFEKPRPVRKEKPLEIKPTEPAVERRAPEPPQTDDAEPTDPRTIEIAFVKPEASKPETEDEVAESAVEPPQRRRTETKIEVMEAPQESVDSVASKALDGTDFDEPPQPYPQNRLPHYPPEAYARRQQGRVVLRLWIGSDGLVNDARVVKSSGVPGMDDAAVDAALTWRFRPAKRAGDDVTAVYDAPVNFIFRG